MPSARKKLAVPPPDAGTSPFSAVVNVSRSAVTSVPLAFSGLPDPAVTRALIVPKAMFASLSLPTASAAMVVAKLPVPLPVTSPVKVIV